MTSPRDPDLILAAWLDEHAIPLPTTTQRAIDVAIRTTPQQQRSWWSPRRLEPMNNFLRLGVVAVAIVVIALGSITFLQQGPAPGVGASPVPIGSSSPAPDPSTWETFTSERYGFEVRHPSGWDTYQATDPNPIYLEDSEAERANDRITVGTGFSGLYVASAPIEGGLTPEAWMERYACPCEPDLAEWERLEVDGQPAFARLESSMEPFITHWVFTEGRVYNILAAGFLTRDPVLRDALLSTVRLHPEDAVDTP